jgi:methylmalonyl-CoA mutase N-terminal domain/subunit
LEKLNCNKLLWLDKNEEGGIQAMEKKLRIPIEEAYFAKPTWLKTWSGISLKEVYTPDDVKGTDYARDVGDPGQFPYVRGVYSDMYRGRLWSVREVSGHTSPRVTNEWLRYLVSEGANTVNVIGDQPNMNGIDPDHPMAEGAVGLMGCPSCSFKDMEIMTDGLPLDKLSFTLTMPWVHPLAYLAVCQKRGVPWTNIRATYLSFSTLTLPLTRYVHTCDLHGLGMRIAADALNWFSTNVPRSYPICIGSEGIRESGATAAQEIAWSFVQAKLYLKEALKRGGEIDVIAPHISYTHRCGIDIFEEAAKFRAARRVWAKMLRDDFGAQSPRSLTYKVHVVTKGSDLVPQQAECNIVRIAYQALATILGGVQSMHTCSFDEPICLPTDESVRIALRTQQILAYETGVTSVADPLGGSYYVESLTNQLAEEITNIIREWDEKDMIEAVNNEELMNTALYQAYQFQRGVEAGERIVVGLNKFTIPEEEEREARLFQVDEAAVEEYIAEVKGFKRKRDHRKVKEALVNLRRCADDREMNCIPAAIEAVKAGATGAEIGGVMRMSYGYSYDPFEMVDYPF